MYLKVLWVVQLTHYFEVRGALESVCCVVKDIYVWTTNLTTHLFFASSNEAFAFPRAPQLAGPLSKLQVTEYL